MVLSWVGALMTGGNVTDIQTYVPYFRCRSVSQSCKQEVMAAIDQSKSRNQSMTIACMDIRCEATHYFTPARPRSIPSLQCGFFLNASAQLAPNLINLIPKSLNTCKHLYCYEERSQYHCNTCKRLIQGSTSNCLEIKI